MTDIQLYTEISRLPSELKQEVADFIDSIKLKSKQKTFKAQKRVSGKAKGLVSMKDNFDDPIDGFKEYM
jgi:hypothetical protein